MTDEPKDLAEYLRSKINDKGWSAEQFAKRLDRDGGTIRQILRGRRIPKSSSSILEDMAAELKIPLKELEEYCTKSHKQREILQVTKSPNKELQNIAEPLIGIEGGKANFNITNRLVFEQKTGTLKSSKELAETIIYMLNKLPKVENSDDRILLTFQGPDGIFDSDPALRSEYQNSLSRALAGGWDIFHLIRLDNNYRRRTYEIVSNSFRLFGLKGEYIPLYFKKKSVLMPPYGLFIISRKEALVSFATNQPFSTDSAIYTKDEEQLKILEAHFEQLQSQTEPIFQQYNTYEQSGFVKTLARVDAEPGERIILTRRMCEITRPIEWYNPNSRWAKELLGYLKKSSPSGTDLSRHIANRKRRAETLQMHLEINRDFCRYIYSKSCLRDFVDKGITTPYYFQATKEERIEQLKRMIDLLRYQKYEMALVDDETDNRFFSRIEPSFCEVQGNHVVFMEFWSKSEDGSNTSKWFLCNEGVVGRAFQEYLSRLWSNLPDSYKDKEEIIEWIQKQIYRIEDGFVEA